uniref:RE1-silencing transcription factor A n=1 Tax=Cacopsylla melanoneura TaxID=428564 RepID=A0A8D8Z0K5_9HEMI
MKSQNYNLSKPTCFSVSEYQLHTCVHCLSFRSHNVNFLIEHCESCSAMPRPDPFKHKYVCYACTYYTYHKGNIIKHVRIHFDDKPFKCETCGYRATQRSTLNRHLRRIHAIDTNLL